MKGIVFSKHVPEFSDVPTLTQLNYKQDMIDVWCAFFAPAEVPSQITGALVSPIEKVIRDPIISSKLANFGMVQEYESPNKLFMRMVEEYKMIEEIAKKFGMMK